MNARPTQPGDRSRTRTRRERRLGCSLPHAACALLALCGSARSQDALALLVAADAASLLAAAPATVRGEAALVMAGTADLTAQARLLALAADPEPAARQRALLALGLCGSPGAVQFLAECLDDSSARGDDDTIVAAFALGLVRDHAATTATTRFLARVPQSSWKRQREPLLALLLGMTFQPERAEVGAMRQLWDDASNRDAEVRGLLLRHLLANDRSLDGRTLRRALDRGTTPERDAVLHWLASDGGLDPEWLVVLDAVATHSEVAAHRALALAGLTRARHAPALELALRALRHGTPLECTQAMHTLLQLGGARMLRAAAPRITDERDGARKAAMLLGFAAPPTAEFAEHLAHVAADADAAWPLRTAAAIALGRAHPERQTPWLALAFRRTDNERNLEPIAHALLQGHETPTLLRLLAPGVDLPADPMRWIALLRAGHPEAERAVLLHLRPGPEHAPLAALRAFRLARVLAMPAAREDAIPAVLRELLRP